MKEFAKYFLALLCIIFIADRGLGYLFNKLYLENKTGSTGGKINNYLSSATPELLIMGSSRSLSVIPDSFKVSCFNLGHEGMDDAFQTGLLDILIHEKKTPKTILLHVDPEQYSSVDTDSYSRGIQNLRYYYGKDELVTQYINEISFHERFFFMFDLYRYNGRAINLLKNALVSHTSALPSKGCELLQASAGDSLNTIEMEATQKYHDGFFKMYRLRYLFKFISLCKENHIHLLLFTSPLYKNPVTESFVFDSIINSKNIPYINYLRGDFPKVQSNPSLWKDPVHLNSTGAALFSSDLAKRVKLVLDAK